MAPDGRMGEDRMVVATYREYVPAPELRGDVRAFFSFTPGFSAWPGPRAVKHEARFARADSFRSPLFADGRASLVVELGATCRLDVGWTSGTPVRALAMGALPKVGAPAGDSCAEMVGVYFEPGSTSALLRVPAVELTDRVVELDLLSGSRDRPLAERLAELDEAARIDLLEAVLIDWKRRAAAPGSGLDVRRLARWARAEPAGMNVRRLAEAAGVSRQHLTRVFRETIGVGPKRFCRLARFQAGLVHAGAGAGVPWAQVAAELGYADQSHMIAEFRELSSLTPESLAARNWFHPFILEARSRVPPTGLNS